MKFEKTYLIKKGEWTKWSDTIANAIEDYCPENEIEMLHKVKVH